MIMCVSQDKMMEGWLTCSYVCLFVGLQMTLSANCLLLVSPSPSAPQFSLFGSRSATRTATNPPSSSSSSSSLIQSTQTVKRTGRPPCSSGLSKAEFLERVRRSNEACQQGEYALAVQLYSEALTADPQNCILYSNRSAAYLRLGQYSTALDDAIKARLINPKWPKVRNQTPGDRCVVDLRHLPPNHLINGIFMYIWSQANYKRF